MTKLDKFLDKGLLDLLPDKPLMDYVLPAEPLSNTAMLVLTIVVFLVYGFLVLVFLRAFFMGDLVPWVPGEDMLRRLWRKLCRRPPC